MRQHQSELMVETKGRGLIEITRPLARVVAASGIATGLATVFIRHTSASLVIQENADPDVVSDLVAKFDQLVPDGDPLYVHVAEGPDDMSAHVKSALSAVSLSIPVADGRPALGTWQGVFVFEHRLAPHRRRVVVHVVGE